MGAINFICPQKSCTCRDISNLSFSLFFFFPTLQELILKSLSREKINAVSKNISLCFHHLLSDQYLAYLLFWSEKLKCKKYLLVKLRETKENYTKPLVYSDTLGFSYFQMTQRSMDLRGYAFESCSGWTGVEKQVPLPISWASISFAPHLKLV